MGIQVVPIVSPTRPVCSKLFRENVLGKSAKPELSAVERLCLLGNLDSLVVDYCARQKLGGSSFSYFVIRQLSVMAPVTFRRPSAWSDNLVLSEWLAPDFSNSPTPP